jgi:hypothetical protein
MRFLYGFVTGGVGAAEVASGVVVVDVENVLRDSTCQLNKNHRIFILLCQHKK